MNKTTRFILSIDGGGMRGLIPLRVLEALESRLTRRGVDLPMHKVFDLMVGTSTGGLIAAGLSAPRPGSTNGEAATTIDELRAFFERDAREIFTQPLSARFAKRVANPLGFLDETYDVRPFEKFLKERFGWTSMASGLTRLVLCAYDIERRKSVFMTNGLEDNGRRPDDYYFWQAVRAATATPSLFGPASIENLTDKCDEAMIDASLYMSDPSMAAYLEAEKLGWENEEIVILSLGTGLASGRGFDYEASAGWGSDGWMRHSNGSPLLATLTDAQSQTSAYQAKRLFEKLPNVQYHRIDGDLAPEAEGYDNARPGNIIVLNGAADRMIRDHTVLLDDLADLLKDRLFGDETDAQPDDLVHAA